MEQLRIAENLLAFLASLSLSVLQKQDYAEAGIDFRKLWDTGVAFETWKLVIQKSAEIFRSYKGHALASAIAGLDIAYEKKGFGADVAALSTARTTSITAAKRPVKQPSLAPRRIHKRGCNAVWRH